MPLRFTHRDLLREQYRYLLLEHLAADVAPERSIMYADLLVKAAKFGNRMGWAEQRSAESLDWLTTSPYMLAGDPVANHNEQQPWPYLFGELSQDAKREPREPWHITDSGYRHVEEMQKKRGDAVERVSKLRWLLLVWAYEKERGGESFSWNSFIETEHPFCGIVRFSREEVERQIRYLKSRERVHSRVRLSWAVAGGWILVSCW
jgi:hypothetical protein